MQHFDEHFTLYPFRPRASIGCEAMPLVVATSALFVGFMVAFFVAPVHGEFWTVGLLAVCIASVLTVSVGVILWRLWRPVTLHIRANDIVLPNRIIPHEEITDCVVHKGGALRSHINASSGDWRSPGLDESIDRVERIAGTIQALVLAPDP